MYSASCLCGEIQFQIQGQITDIIHCHCSKCRKSSGTAYATNGFVLLKDFRLQQGQALISSYATSDTSKKYFCSQCASPLYSQSDSDPLRIRLRLGLLDNDISERPSSHNFVTSRANWDQFNDRLPHYKTQEPTRSQAPKIDK